MYCPNCGSPLSDGDRFCGRCGTPVSSKAACGGSRANGTSPSSGQARPTARQTPPVAPTPPGRRGGRSATRRTVVIGAAAAATVCVAAGVAVAWSKLGGGASASDAEGTATGTTSSDTLQAGALVRPRLVSLPEGDTTQPAPALASYRSDASEGDSGSDGGANSSDASSSSSGSLDLDPSSAVNAEAFGSLTDTVFGDGFEASLRCNGFAISARGGYDEFYQIYESNRYDLRANFVTVDSLMHTYHLYFFHLLRNAERSTLTDRLTTLSQSLLTECQSQLDALSGSEWESAARRAVAFSAVALRLLGQTGQVPSDLEDEVASEVQAIEDASGTATSAVMGALEDYTQYKPRGYYAGEDQLERYFRTMMWYGRCNFTQSDEDLDRSACLITLAIHDAAVDDWEAVYAITSFFAGASDDNGYCEYYPVVEAAFGDGVKAADLVGNSDGWQTFHATTATLEAPKINSAVYVDTSAGSGQVDEGSSDELEGQKGFRLMGQRFTFDEAIFEQLLPDAIGNNSQGEARSLPSGLDVTAALGSDAALSILQDEGATDYQGYSDNMEALRGALANAGDDLWCASLYSQWLYTLNPLLAERDDSYPDFMRTDAWDRRSLQTYLGSYTELKHDTVLYAKQVMVEMGGEGVDNYDDRGLVEPEPELYRRMANLVRCTSSGLANYDALGDDDASNLDILASLADQLTDIATAELAGTTLTSDQYELIRSYGGQLEHFWTEVYKGESSKGESITARDFPAAIVTDVASNANTGTCLELGTGKVNTIYVLFELEGGLHIASGGSYSYYEFEQPMSDRLTDSAWREMMGIEAGDDMSYSQPSVGQPSWVDGFTFET